MCSVGALRPTSAPTTMAFTQTDLDNVRAAIASGELSVMHNGRRVEYRSVSELLQAESRISADLAAAAPGAVRGGPRRFTFTTYRGD